MVRLFFKKNIGYICKLKYSKYINLKTFYMKKSLLQTVLMGGALLLVVLTSCKKEEKPGQLESLQFKQASYEIVEIEQDFYLKKEIQTVPEGVIDTAKIAYAVDDNTLAYIVNDYVMPLKPGTINVTATIQGKSASCAVVIKPAVIKSFELEDFAVKINCTAKALLTTNPTGISRERFTWSVGDKTIATIDQSGVVTGLKEGSTTVTATADGKSKTCKLAVKKVVVDKVVVTPESATLRKIDETIQLSAELTPPDASFTTVTWKSESQGNVTVDANGLVTVKKYSENPVKITASADGQKGVCWITAYPQQATKIVLSETYHEFSKIGDTFTLEITEIEPVQRTLTDQLDWTPGSFISEAGCDKGVCLVDGTVDGHSRTSKHSVTITCTGVGTDKIHCTDYWSHVDAYCTVTMPLKPITSVTLSKTSEEVSIAKGSFTINATVNAGANEKLNWAKSGYGSGDATLSPSEDGLSVTVTPKKAGYFAITASSKSTSAKCELYIVEDIDFITDWKGGRYKTVKIGTQWWMAQDFRCKYYDSGSGRSGDYIGESSDVISAPYFFNSRTSSSYGDWSADDKEKVGFAYNWAAAVGLGESAAAAQTGSYSGRCQGICPNGWHIPSVAEFNTLKNYIGGDWWLLASRKRWKIYGNPDKYGFCAMPVGIYNGGGSMAEVGEKCEFWTADASSTENAKSMYLNSYTNPISGNVYMDADIRSTSKKSRAYSVRCIKN